MSTTQVYSSENREHPGIIGKSALLVYGLTSYTVGVAGLSAIVLLMAGLIPAGLFQVTGNNTLAVIINVALVCLFGLQHSLMARPWFKAFFHNLFGQAGERSTFVWSSGVVALILVAGWQSVDGIIWQATSTVLVALLWVGFAVGWVYLLAATFAINHWDLFGLRQVWLGATGRPYSAPQFKESWMYRYSRHPIMLGVLIGIWSVPDMTASKFVLTLCFTAYVFVGVWFEERDLIRHLGGTYQNYKQRVRMFF